MRSEVQHHFLLAFSENQGVCERRETRSDFDRSTSGVVQDSIIECPPVDVPYPASNRAVYKCGPEENEHQCRNQTSALGNGPHYDSSSNSTEL